jgi:hypothetical protein
VPEVIKGDGSDDDVAMSRYYAQDRLISIAFTMFGPSRQDGHRILAHERPAATSHAGSPEPAGPQPKANRRHRHESVQYI